MNNVAYLLALHCVDGLGPIRLKAILNYFKDPKLAWEANDRELREIQIPQTVVERLAQTRKAIDPLKYAEDIRRSNIKWMTIFDPDYPKLLSEIYDPPVVLYYQGQAEVLNSKSIAVVGTRKMTGYGKTVTEQFTKVLTNAGLTIVSGLARGVDSQAHKTTVLENGKTVAVLGGGLSNIFPPENKNLALKIANSGAVISEYPPDYFALPGNFPQRNRIISGLSLAVVVIEAAEDSGSLITARLALEQGRDVFAVPGPVTSSLSKGPIDLIKMGAIAVFAPEEILQQLGITKVKSVQVNENNLSEEERLVLGCLENENMHIDEVGRKLSLEAAKISALLLKMEISGLVHNLGSGVYCKR